MKYQKNIALKLREMGFTHSQTVKNSEVDYEFWIFKSIDITIDHGEKQVIIEISEQYAKGVKSLSDLKKLIALIG